MNGEVGPRSAFELQTAHRQACTDLPTAIASAHKDAAAAGFTVTEVLRVGEELLADGEWWWLVTLRVFPTPGRTTRVPVSRAFDVVAGGDG